ncbi:MAG: hypothetical protein AB8B49_00575 [Nitratireductor sp.]
MLQIAIYIHLLVATGLALLAAYYLFGPVPTSYHAKILEKWKLEIQPQHKIGFQAINLILGALLLALSLCIFVVTSFAITQGILWAKLLIASMGLITGCPATYIAYKIEKATGVKTPWRIALAMTLCMILAFALSIN